MTALGKKPAVRTLLVMAALAAALPAAAQDNLEALTRAEAEARAEKARLDAAREAVSGEIATLKRQLAQASREAQSFERESARLGVAVERAEARLSELQSELDDNRSQTVELLAALQRLSLQPSVAAIADPEDAVASAQAAGLIDGLSEELQRKADALVRLADAQRDAAETARRRREELSANNRELARRRDRIAVLVKDKEAARADIVRNSEAASAEVARLAAESRNLRELLERLSEPVPDAGPSLKPARPDTADPVARPSGSARFAEAKGSLVRPVAGALTRGFGRGDRGQSYDAVRDAQVVAPYSGRVEFAGPFKGHGRVVILNMDDDYFILLTGLEQIFVNARETVLRGEPIGAMPTAGAELYMELRHKGRTIDPAPWFG